MLQKVWVKLQVIFRILHDMPVIMVINYLLFKACLLENYIFQVSSRSELWQRLIIQGFDTSP